MAVRGGTGLSRQFDVLVAGDLFVDLILGGFTEWPGAGTEVFAKEYRRDVGGGAAITACGLARLGSDASVLSVVGHDTGNWVTERLAEFGVDTSELRFHDTEPTAFSVGVSTAQDRTFLTYQGANRRFPEVLAETAKSGGLRRTRHIHLGWAPPLETAAGLMAAIRANGCTISLDTGWHEAWLADEQAMERLREVDIFVPNELEALRMTGEQDPERSLRAYETAGARRVVLKLGATGAAMLWDGEIFHAEPCRVTPVDTIGAGDAFDAGFLHYWLRGEAPPTCLQAANICGALSTEAYGGVAGFPDAARVQELLKDSLCEK